MLELARPGDWEVVNALALQIHEMHVAWRPDIFEMVPQLYSEERFLDAVKQRQLYVARIDGVVAGYALLKIRDYDWPGAVRRKVMEIDELCVDELCRGQGIGMEMMADIHALARAFRCTDLQLGVYPQNDHAVGFYQKCGFTIRSIAMQRTV